MSIITRMVIGGVLSGFVAYAMLLMGAPDWAVYSVAIVIGVVVGLI